MSSLALRSEVNEKDRLPSMVSRATTAPADSLEGRLANPLDKFRDISVDEWHERVVATLNDKSRPLPQIW